MPTIRIRVRDKIAENLTPEVKIVCGNEDYQVEFDLDEAWGSSNIKTGLFVRNGELIAQPFEGEICPVPVIENASFLAIGCSSSDGLLKTTTPAYADCIKSVKDLATSEIPAPTKSEHDKIAELLNKYVDIVCDINGELEEILGV